MPPPGDAASILPPGTVLAGRFRVLRVLGAGGMGAVYEIEHELTRHRRALKLLHPEASASPEIVTRFLREASAAGHIGDPHIVEIFDAGSLETGAPYVVMELLAGETLGSRLAAEGQLGFLDLCDLVGQTCEGVQAAHDAGIVHRDLKPENLFVITRDGRPFVKILDFGVSKFAVELTGGVKNTRDGAALGTPLYMAPEQMWGEPDLDGRADVYSLGVLLYEGATGQPPFLASSLAQLAVLVHEGKPAPLETLRPDLPASFHDLVIRAMAPARADRIATARALGEELRAIGKRYRPDALGATLAQPSSRSVEAAPLAETALPEPAVPRTPASTEGPPVALLPAPEAPSPAPEASPPPRRAAWIPFAAAIAVGCAIAAAALLRRPDTLALETSTRPRDVGASSAAPGPSVAAVHAINASAPIEPPRSSPSASAPPRAEPSALAPARSIRTAPSGSTRAQQTHLAEDNPIPR